MCVFLRGLQNLYKLPVTQNLDPPLCICNLVGMCWYFRGTHFYCQGRLYNSSEMSDCTAHHMPEGDWLSSYSLLWDFQNLQCHSYFKLSPPICTVSFLWVCIFDLLSLQRLNPKIHFAHGVFPQAPWWSWTKFSIRGLCVTLLSLLSFIAHFSTGTCSV